MWRVGFIHARPAPYTLYLKQRMLQESNRSYRPWSCKLETGFSHGVHEYPFEPSHHQDYQLICLLYFKTQFFDLRTSNVISTLSMVSSDSKSVFISYRALYSSSYVLASFTAYPLSFPQRLYLWNLVVDNRISITIRLYSFSYGSSQS